jgi:hypothetical protein
VDENPQPVDTLDKIVDEAIVDATNQTPPPKSQTMYQRFRPFANTRDAMTRRQTAYEARFNRLGKRVSVDQMKELNSKLGGRRKTRRGGGNAFSKRLAARLKVLKPTDEEPRVSFKTLVTVEGEAVATTLLPVFDAFISWRTWVMRTPLVYLPETVADAETLFVDALKVHEKINPVFTKRSKDFKDATWYPKATIEAARVAEVNRARDKMKAEAAALRAADYMRQAEEQIKEGEEKGKKAAADRAAAAEAAAATTPATTPAAAPPTEPVIATTPAAAPATTPAAAPPPPGLTAWIEVLDAAARANVSDEQIDAALDTPSPDPAVNEIKEAIKPLLRIRIPPNPDDEEARTSAIASGLMTLDLTNREPIPIETPLPERQLELAERLARHRIETPPATPSDITVWIDGPLETEPPPVRDPELRKLITKLFDKVAPVLSHLDMASVPKPISAQPPPAPLVANPTVVPPPAIPPPSGAPTVEMPPAELAVEPVSPTANEFITPGFEDRINAAKVKFDALQALRVRAEQSLDTLEVSVKKNNRFKNVKRGRITNADLNKHYDSSTFKAKEVEVMKQKADREARRTRRALRLPAPKESTQLAEIGQKLSEADTVVKDYATQLESARAEFAEEIKNEPWNATIDKQLELEFDFLLRVERVLADVPPSIPVAPPSLPIANTLDKADAAIAYAKSRMEKTKAARDRLNAVMPPRPPWKPGGRRTPRRKMRKSTFRRNRKH